MRSLSTRKAQPLRRHALLVLILALAAGLRWANIGAEPFSTDEAAHTLRALDVARNGNLTLQGTPMSVGLWHSPLAVYLYAIPFGLSSDPRLARAFTGLLNVVAVGVVYVIGTRYFDRKAGVVAALLYAIHPEALVATRKIWNPALGAPFVMLFVLSGLLGYYEDKRWARIANLPLLSLAGQCHPATFLLAPITAVLWTYAWRNRAHQRRQLSAQLVMSGVLALLLLLPWALGLYLAGRQADAQPAFDMLPNRGLGYLVDTLYIQLGNWPKNLIQPIQPLLTAIGALWLTARALQRRSGLPGLIVVAGFLLVPITTLLLDIQYRAYHLWPSYGNAYLIQGALIGGVLNAQISGEQAVGFWHWRGLLNDRILRWLALPAVAAVVLTQLRFFTQYDRSGGAVGLTEHIAAIHDAAEVADRTGRELLLLSPAGKDRNLQWDALNAEQQARVVWDGRALPLPADGAILLGFADYTGRPFLFSEGEIVHGGFRLAALPPASEFSPDLRPLQPVRFSNGASMLGFLRAVPGSLPRAVQPWTIFMLWRVDQPGTEEYTLFTHVVDANGGKYAQLDVPGLPVGQWRVGEYVLSQLDFDFGAGFPASGPLYLRFGMYSNNHQAHTLDEEGHPNGPFGTLQIRAGGPALATWRPGLALLDLKTNSPLQQGPPLAVTATWHVAQTPATDVRLHWRLAAPEGASAFEQVTVLVPDTRAWDVPSGSFVTETYSLRIPTDLTPGAYQLALQLTDDRAQPVGPLYQHAAPVEVTPRARSFERPALVNTVRATFADEIELLGYDLQQTDALLHLTLYWHALGQVTRDYKYFVHVWQADRLVAQVDAMPAAYRYPTSWWAPGEVFSDPIQVDLSALDSGEYTLTTGLYDPVSGERLAIALSDGTPAPQEWVVLQDFAYANQP